MKNETEEQKDKRLAMGVQDLKEQLRPTHLT